MEGLSTNGSLELEGWVKNKRALLYQEFMLALNKLAYFWEGQASLPFSRKAPLPPELLPWELIASIKRFMIVTKPANFVSERRRYA
jgi:hypothetical protein